LHRPDLPLYDDRLKLGLGLWNFPVAASALEIVFLFGGMYLYWLTANPMLRGGRYGMLMFGLAMLAIQAVVFFGPPPPSAYAAAITALISYFVFAGVAYGLENKRV